MTSQFDSVYRLPPAASDNPGNRRKQQFLQEEQIRRQAQVAARPSNMAFFEHALSAPTALPRRRPRVGLFCNLVPPELVMAAGADPVRLDCGNAAAAVHGEEILAGDVCPLSKASLGMFLRSDSMAAACDAIVVAASCDAKKKMGELLADFKPTYVMAVPPEQDHERHAAEVTRDLDRLGRFLAARFGTRPDGGALRRAIELTNARSRLVARLQDIRIVHPRALGIRDFFTIVQASLFSPLPLEDWLAQAGAAADEAARAADERRSLRPRLVLTGAPMAWPNFKVLNVLEECGADVVADTLCTGAQACLDPVVCDERGRTALLRALAGRSVFGALCPCFISQTRRLHRVLDLCATAHARGVVHYLLRLCQLFDVENYRLEKVLKERRIPCLALRTDYSQEDTEQLRVRIEAFLETL